MPETTTSIVEWSVGAGGASTTEHVVEADAGSGPTGGAETVSLVYEVGVYVAGVYE